MADPMQQAREQFEAWASTRGMPRHRRGFPSSERRGEYGNAYTQDCWEAWQAAALRAAPEGYVLVQTTDAECLVRDAERYLDGGRSAGGRLAAKRVRSLLAARPQGVR